MKITIATCFVRFFCTAFCLMNGVAAEWPPLMPRSDDYTRMWWRAGYPKRVPGAPWHRCVTSGNYGFVFDTQSLAVPHLGPFDGGPLSDLPGADLELILTVDGKAYRARHSEEPTRFTGPRIIESGNFLQRADVTNLVFTGEDGTVLNQESRIETAAWGDQLSMILSARPGKKELVPGDGSFGRVKGGFGLTGSNRFDIPAEECELGEKFTVSFHVLPHIEFKAGQHFPWLMCKNKHEQARGNIGITLDRDGTPIARFNIEGGRGKGVSLSASRRSALRREVWNHLAVSYDGDVFRLFVNGDFAGEAKVGKAYLPTPGGLCFGDREDGVGEGAYRFRGVIDEVQIFDRALQLGELRTLGRQPERNLKASGRWSFRSDIAASSTRPRENWQSGSMEISLSQGGKELRSNIQLQPNVSDWRETALVFDPVTFEAVAPQAGISITATETATGTQLPVIHEPAIGWHKIDLNNIVPIPPKGQQNPTNDAMERVRLQLSNTGTRDQTVRLVFAKTGRGIRQRIGTAITGISAVLRDPDGNPTGIPVQLSKNWHVHPEGGVYSGSWFHGISLVHLPKGKNLNLELCVVYGHWGGLPAASHAQLSLIGWGNNQLWEQSALGSWGESICYDPDQHNAGCTITDVRPVMVTSMSDRDTQWNWTNNHGGGDFFRLIDREGNPLPHSRVRTTYQKQGPCLTEVTYSGMVGAGIHFSNTVSLARTDDIVCGTYRIRMKVSQPVEFSRFAIFQIGADTYLSTREKRFAAGYQNGVEKEWEASWGGNTYKGEPFPVKTDLTWVSLHDAFVPEGEKGARVNRGIILRNWKGRLGGREAQPLFAEYGVDRGRALQASTIDLIPPSDIQRLEPGDFIEATIEHLMMPRLAEDYYGPNEALRTALKKHQNTWKMIERQAVEDRVGVEAKTGQVMHLYPDIRIRTVNDTAEFTVEGGLGFIPVTFTNLSTFKNTTLTIDGEAFDQSVHGKDFWQTDYDPQTGKWSQTYNIPGDTETKRTIRISRE